MNRRFHLRGAAALLALAACFPVPEVPRPVLEGPGGARVFLPAGSSFPNGVRLVLADGKEPALPRDLVSLSATYSLQPGDALGNLDLDVALPTTGSRGEIYTSDGSTWVRAASTDQGGVLRAVVGRFLYLTAAASRPLVWHEVSAPRGGLTSFAFSNRRIYAMSPVAGAVVSRDGGESWSALPATETAPPRDATAARALDEVRPGGPSCSGEICALAAAGDRLFAALDDGTIRFSEDQGASWHDYSGGLPSGIARATSLASDGANLFASLGGRTFKARAR